MVTALIIFIVVAALSVAVWWMVAMPGQSHDGPLPPLSAREQDLAAILTQHVEHIGGTIGERNFLYPEKLQEAARYIEDQMRATGAPVQKQDYTLGEQTFSNIIAERRGRTRPGEVIVVGAHYDSVSGSPGANDNGTGVAALLALLSICAPDPDRTVRFIAFANEEPPFFGTDEMGSRVYARSGLVAPDRVIAMLALETIGYYTDKPGSQHYPFPFDLFYPRTGNFIAFVANFHSRALLHRVLGHFRDTTSFPAEGVAAPGFIPGIAWSDHWSFWRAGVPALMVTDTAPFRYPHYHRASDRPEFVDYPRFARVVEGLRIAVDDLASHH